MVRIIFKFVGKYRVTRDVYITVIIFQELLSALHYNLSTANTMPYRPPLYGIFWGHVFCKYGGWGWSELFPHQGQTQELSGTPNHQYFLKSIAGTNGRRTAVQIRGVLWRFPFFTWWTFRIFLFFFVPGRGRGGRRPGRWPAPVYFIKSRGKVGGFRGHYITLKIPEAN